MRGFFNLVVAAIAIISIITTALFVAPIVTGGPIPFFGEPEKDDSGSSGGSGGSSTPQAPPAAPPEPPVLVVDSLMFCQQLDGDSCSTHSTSFTNIQRVYATVEYSQAKIDEYFAFVWYKKTGSIETELSGDGQGIVEEAGSFTTSLTAISEDQPLSMGTYVFKLVNEDDEVLKAAEFIVN